MGASIATMVELQLKNLISWALPRYIEVLNDASENRTVLYLRGSFASRLLTWNIAT